MTRKLDSLIPSPAPNALPVVVTVSVHTDGRTTVVPDCVSVDADKHVVWRFALPLGRTLIEGEPVQFTFDPNPPYGPFDRIERVGSSNDWISVGNSREPRLFHYNIAAQLASPAGPVAVEIDPVIYNTGKPPNGGSESEEKEGGEAKKLD